MLSNKFKIPGYLLVFTGINLAVLYFGFDFRFEIPVIALFSSFMETRFFTSFRTNFADELIMLILLCGFVVAAFSKEKKETDHIKTLRIKALIRAIIISTSIMAFSVLFIYGSGFMAFVIVNMFMPFIIYLFLFNMMKKMSCREEIQRP
jgi:amino acid transporter